jgi:hypothetical protein
MEFYTVTTENEAKDLQTIMPDIIAVDTEYVPGDPRWTKLLSVIVADGDRAWVVSPSLLPMLTPTLKSRSMIFLQDYNHCDTIILLKHGCDLRNTPCYNLIDMHHLLDENAEHSLGPRVLAEFGDDYKTRLKGQYENLEYQCKDGIYTFRLGMSDLSRITGDLWVLYSHVRQLSSALLETELNGLSVNVSLMEETTRKTAEDIASYLRTLRGEFNDYAEIWELREWHKKCEKLKTVSGRLGVPRPSFSFESDKQIAWLLYEALGLPVITKTKTGNPSTDFETLQTLSKDYPSLKSLVKFKDIKSLYATFMEGMLTRVVGNKIYPSFNVSGTTTGRLSHSNPNMGNLPKEGVIRNFFIPSPGMVIIGADYEQLEVVVELNLTDDPGLKEIVCGGASKHDLFKEDLDKAGFKIPRSQVKNINFALQYGAGAKKISKMVGCSLDDAEQIIATFYTRFSGVKALKDQTEKQIRDHGFITNLAGRTRHFGTARNNYELARSQRQAYNFLIQGVAAEACNRSFYRLELELSATPGRPLFSVHDEIVAEIDSANSESGMELICKVMGQATEDFNFKYPLTAKAYGPLTCWAKT